MFKILTIILLFSTTGFSQAITAEKESAIKNEIDKTVKVYVNSKQITNEDLKIPENIGNTKVLVEYKLFKNNIFFHSLN